MSLFMNAFSLLNINIVLSSQITNVYRCKREIRSETGKIDIPYIEPLLLYHEFLILENGTNKFVLEFVPEFPCVQLIAQSNPEFVDKTKVDIIGHYSLLRWVYSMYSCMSDRTYHFLSQNCQEAVTNTIKKVSEEDRSLYFKKSDQKNSHFRYIIDETHYYFQFR